MRVLITTDTVGGVWTFTQELAGALLARGSSVCLVSLGGLPDASQQEWVAAARGAYTHQFLYEALDTSLEWMDDNKSAYSGAASRLVALSKIFEAELLHSNQFCFGSLPVSVPKLVTAHSDVLSWADACRSGKLDETPWLRRYRALVADGLKGAQCAAAPTQWMAHALRRHFETPANLRVIANGRSLPMNAHRPTRKLQAVTAGRLWDEAKNLRILEDFQPALPILVAGATASDGSCSPGTIMSNVQFVGALPGEKLLSLFRESAVYICTSLYEPFGLAPLEAALAGCAVLANDIPSLREVWGDGALFFSIADELTVLLRRLVADSDFLKQAQERSGARAQLYPAARMVDGYCRLYAEMLSRREVLDDVA